MAAATDTKNDAKTVDSKEAGQRTAVSRGADGKIELREPDTNGWTAQQGGSPVEELAVPGQVFVKEQLPDPDAQRAWGIDPDQQNAGLIVLDAAEALKHPSGPEPTDVVVTTGLISGDVRQPDRLQDPDGTLRVPDGLPESETAGTTADTNTKTTDTGTTNTGTTKA